jgi:hypothetical protein
MEARSPILLSVEKNRLPTGNGMPGGLGFNFDSPGPGPKIMMARRPRGSESAGPLPRPGPAASLSHGHCPGQADSESESERVMVRLGYSESDSEAGEPGASILVKLRVTGKLCHGTPPGAQPGVRVSQKTVTQAGTVLVTDSETTGSSSATDSDHTAAGLPGARGVDKNLKRSLATHWQPEA